MGKTPRFWSLSCRLCRMLHGRFLYSPSSGFASREVCFGFQSRKSSCHVRLCSSLRPNKSSEASGLCGETAFLCSVSGISWAHSLFFNWAQVVYWEFNICDRANTRPCCLCWSVFSGGLGNDALRGPNGSPRSRERSSILINISRHNLIYVHTLIPSYLIRAKLLQRPFLVLT